MKKACYYLSVALLAIFTSCGEDKDPDPKMNPEGSFTVNGEAFNLDFGYKEDFGSNDNGSFDVDVYLSSEAIDLNTDGESLSNISVVYLDLNTNQRNELQTGTYTYGDERDELVMVDASVGANISTDANGDVISGTLYIIVDGSVTITQSGDNYTISFTLTSTEGTTITGSYTGTISAA